jgi:lipoate-protein ligase B
LARLSIPAERNTGYTGVWTGGRKIASIGIHVRQWVTTHGFALNVVNDLSPFGLIVPCGIPGVEMTSVAKELERRQTARPENLRQQTAAVVVAAFAEVFGLDPVPARLAEVLPPSPQPAALS